MAHARIVLRPILGPVGGRIPDCLQALVAGFTPWSMVGARGIVSGNSCLSGCGSLDWYVSCTRAACETAALSSRQSVTSCAALCWDHEQLTCSQSQCCSSASNQPCTPRNGELPSCGAHSILLCSLVGVLVIRVGCYRMFWLDHFSLRMRLSESFTSLFPEALRLIMLQASLQWALIHFAMCLQPCRLYGLSMACTACHHQERCSRSIRPSNAH